MRYCCRAGCQWRRLPGCFPPWSAVYYYCRRWQLTGRWQQLNEAIVAADRRAAERAATAALVCLASQSLRLAPRIFEHRGTAGGKRVDGRKRQILTDVQGRLLAGLVPAANGHDGVEALPLLPARPSWGQRLVPVLTDKGQRGRFARHLARLGLLHQVGSRPPSADRGVVPIAHGWVVERTVAWLAGFRRLAIDYAFTPRSHETWLLVANTTMGLNRLTAT